MGGVRKVKIVEGFWSMLLISSVYVSSSNDFLVAKHQGPHGALQFDSGKRGLIRLRGGYSLGPGAGAFSDQSRGVADEDEFFRKFGYYGTRAHTHMHGRTHQSWASTPVFAPHPCALSHHHTNDGVLFFCACVYICGCTCVKVGAWPHGLVEFQIRAQTRQL